jgi:7-keto-8-aminopelargonate synthetase-like enzyme
MRLTMECVSPSEGPYVMWQGKKFLDFSSCDFLGLANHPEIRKGGIKYSLRYGVSHPAPPLKSVPQQQLEEKLAHVLNMGAAILFPSYEEAVGQLQTQKVVIFSSDLEEVAPKKTSALICRDDSYTVGITGEQGFGTGLQKGVDLVVGSLACGVGCSGAYIAGTKEILTPFASTASLSYPTIGAIDCALSFILEMHTERKTLASHRAYLAKEVSDLPAKMVASPRAVFTFKSEKEAAAMRQLFLDNQIFLGPVQDLKIYIALTALHTPDDLTQLGAVLKKLSATDLALATQSLTPGPTK